MSNINRKIFNYDQLDQSVVCQLKDKQKLFTNSVSAAGCLFFKKSNKDPELLLIEYADPNWPKLDDLGGQIDLTDNSVMEAIVREVNEESNGLITKNLMDHLLANNPHQTFYNKISKYYSLVIEVDDSFFPDTEVFGTVEKTDNIVRKLTWIPYSQCKSKLCYRLGGNITLLTYLLS